jgi:CHAT domain-containing protein
MIGEQAGYVLSISRDTAQIDRLVVDAAAAGTLGIDPGPLTGMRLQRFMANPSSTGIMQRLASDGSREQRDDQLSALWGVLVPEPVRSAVSGGEVRRLIIIPDSVLSQFPFETLIVEKGADPTFLLDITLAINYAPSATVLFNLKNRRLDPVPPDLKPVLAVGNPKYAVSDARSVARSNTIGAERGNSASVALAKYLTPLPMTANEVRWVAAEFRDNGIAVGTLLDADATEAKVRLNVRGRRIVHLACHGLTDPDFGNLFGSLALTPGMNSSDPRDDGFLTLAEIYDLNLKSCELAILSACETNYGPHQKGEGAWALSRGCLVAGAKRVVASNWRVDDTAAASLITYFCGGIAAAEKKHLPVDFAENLHAAKKQVRQQQNWKSPYYWGTFVLIGP